MGLTDISEMMKYILSSPYMCQLACLVGLEWPSRATVLHLVHLILKEQVDVFNHVSVQILQQRKSPFSQSPLLIIHPLLVPHLVNSLEGERRVNSQFARLTPL